MLAALLKLCCCCCKQTSLYDRKIRRFDSYSAVKGTLDAELDMHRLLDALRITDFLSTITLKRHQRRLVNQFGRFRIQDFSSEVGTRIAYDPVDINRGAEASVHPTESPRKKVGGHQGY